MSSSDANTTNLALRKKVAAFAREREWEQFHTPKNLAAGLSIEAAELLELFLWKTPAEIEEMTRQPQARARLAEELAGVMIFCLNFANRLDIDLATATLTKLEANAVKYPVEKAKGVSRKYTELT
jgi:NTP pyrophosphatase (non-canonical NTP hydrolase)